MRAGDFSEEILIDIEEILHWKAGPQWCGKQNDDRKQDKEAAIAELLIQKPTLPKTNTVQFVCILSSPARIVPKK